MREHLRQDPFAQALIDNYCDPGVVRFDEGVMGIDRVAVTGVNRREGTLIFQFLMAPASALSYLVAHEVSHVAAVSDEDLFKPNLGLPEQKIINNNTELVTCAVGRARELDSIAWHAGLIQGYYLTDVEAHLENLILGSGAVFGATSCKAIGTTKEEAEASFVADLRARISSGNYSLEAFEAEWWRKLDLIRL